MYRLLLLVLLALSSCAPAYLSNSRNTPLFGEAGEFAGAVVLASGLEAQLAGSVTDHVALMANAQFAIKEVTEPEAYSKDYSFFEGGLGYFGRTKTMRWEVFAGYGLGQGNSYESYYFFQTGSQAVVANGKFHRAFLQPSFGTNNKKFNIIFAPRFSFVNFTEFSTEDPAVATALRTVQPTEGFHFVFEPSLITRFHLAGNLYGFFQLNLNTAVPNDPIFTYQSLAAAIGVQLHTGQLRTRVY
jgi:hypothetical protein